MSIIAVSFIDTEVFKQSLRSYEANHFVTFLLGLFGTEKTTRLIETYFIGTSKHWQGATVFWQIDRQGKVRTGKIMLYSPTTGKREKEPLNCITWVHKALKQPEFVLKQCLFGEHLLRDKTKPVAIVESEKTAIIASVYLPQLIWLAVGSLTGLNVEKCKVLAGRNIVLFPDLNGLEKWSSKAVELSHLTRFQISDLLERKATEAERKQGLDLADYLIRFDYREFILPESERIPAEQPPAVQTVVKIIEPEPIEQTNNFRHRENITKNNLAVIGSNRYSIIDELETYFESITLPTEPVRLNQCTMIMDVSKFIKSHLATIKANSGKQTFLPYLNRLQELQRFCERRI